MAVNDFEKMEIGDIKIIASRKGSTPASTWTENLCLKKITNTEFELFVGGYEVVAEASDFYDEETEEDVIPDEIDGYPVMGTIDGYVIGGEILKNEDDGEVRFTDFETAEVRDWLKGIKWGDTNTVSAIQAALKS
jgi:hypothetical protein